MTGKKKVLILCESNLHRAPRVRAEYEALREQYDLLLCGYDAPPFADVTYIHIQRDKKEPVTFHYELPWIFRKPISALLKAKDQLNRISQHRISKKYYPIIHHPEFKNISLVLNHHAGSLPITLKLIKKLKVPFICNLHEFYPGVADEKMTHLKEWMSYEAQLCQELLPKASAVFTVCEGIRQEYLRTFKVDSLVIRNDKPHDARSPVYWTAGEPLRIIHHGAALRARQLEQMIIAVDQLGPNYTMDFMLVASDEEYFVHLKQLAQGKKNIRFIDPVSPDKIVDTLRHYHVGLYSLTPGSINHKLALPNKIFEYVQAKVCIVCSPNQEIKRLVTEHEVGYILPGWTEEDMITALKNLTPERVNAAKDKAQTSAFALSSESTNSLILQTVQQVLNG